TIYNQERESIVRTGWVSSAEYFKNGKVLLSFDKKLTPYLLDLSKNYTQYLLIDTVKLKSKYSILLYKLMREADKDKGKSIAILQGTPEEFKEWLGA
ncbi:replication initiation protein, partial [Streptococcus suis]